MTLASRLLWGLAALLCVGVAVVSYRYLPGVGPLAPNVLANLAAKPWLVVHAGAAATALLVGPVQFLPRLRGARRRLHRWLGRLYVVACLVGGVSGLLLAVGTTAGPVGTFGFGALAVLWLFATGRAWWLARERRFAEHRRWMIRSFALTFAAVTLRLYLPLIGFTGLGFEEAYRAISWLCWVPNVVAAELYLRRRPALAPLAAE